MIAQDPWDSVLSKRSSLGTIKGKSPNLASKKGGGGGGGGVGDARGERFWIGRGALEGFGEEEEEDQDLKTIFLLKFLLPCSCFRFILLYFLSSLCSSFLV